MSKQNLTHTDHLEQGEGGGDQNKSSGSRNSHLDQGTHGARTQKATTSAKGGKIAPVVPGRKASAPGAHLKPHPALTDKTAVRGGGGLLGHDRADPNAGKASSGSSKAQQPGLANAGKKQKVVIGFGK